MISCQAKPTYTSIREPLYSSGPQHPNCWTPEELPPQLSTHASFGEAVSERKEKKRTFMGFPLIVQEAVAVRNPLLASDGNEQANDTDAFSFERLLKTCAKKKDLHTGRSLHADIVKRGLLDTYGFIDNILLNIYAKCGALEKALEVFFELPIHDTVSWTALIAGYAHHGYGEEALNFFHRMQHEGISPDTQTFACALKSCSSIRKANKGQEIHALIVRDCLLKDNLVLANALLDMYVKCGALKRSEEAFNELPFRDVVSWNTLITGYALNGQGEEVLIWFEKMQAGGFSPSLATFLCILKACGSIEAANKGREIHSTIIKEGLLEESIIVGNALADMYVKCGLLADAKQLCDRLPSRDIVTWNTLIGGYAQHGHGKEALNGFSIMQDEGFTPNDVTFTSTLKACSMVGGAEKGQELFDQIVKRDLMKKNIMLANAVVDMFSKCGKLKKAQEVFDKILVKDVVSWNAIMVGYGQQGEDEEVCSCFEQMHIEGFSPDTITFACCLKAYASVGAASKGQAVHTKIVEDGLLEKCMIVGTALVDMYSKCGMLVEAQEIFENLPVRDVVLWNALIAGYSQVGDEKLVSSLIDKLIKEGEEPDLITYTILLNTCSHRGLLDTGQSFFEKGSKAHGFVPCLEHYTCMIDLFGRAGHMNMVMAMIEGMPFSADLTVWLTVLGACGRWENIELGRRAFTHAAKLKDKHSATYS